MVSLCNGEKIEKRNWESGKEKRENSGKPDLQPSAVKCAEGAGASQGRVCGWMPGVCQALGPELLEQS